MRSDNVTTGRVRTVIALSVVSALTLMAGLVLAIVGLVLRTGKHPQHGLIMFGLDVAVAGLAFGAGLLLIFVLLRGGLTSAAARPAPSLAAAARPASRLAAERQSAAAPRRAAATVGAGSRVGPHPGGPARQVPSRAAGPTGAPSHATGPQPQPAGSQPQAAASHPQPAGSQPRATGPLPRATGPLPRAAGGQPAATRSQPHATGPQLRATGPFPAARGTGPVTVPSRAAPATGQAPAAGQVPAAGRNGTAGTGRVPPRQSEAGPGRAAPRRPDGGQNASRPRPDAPVPDAVFVYRDTSDDTEAAAGSAPGADVPSPPPADQEAAYWYGRDEGKAQAAAEPVRGPFEPVRGPFEPLHHPQDAPAPASVPAPSPGPVPGVPDERSDQHARKLEQIKDLYVTAETIGEANVARHFDQFLAQQRELIGDYIKQSKAALQEETPTADPTAP